MRGASHRSPRNPATCRAVEICHTVVGAVVGLSARPVADALSAQGVSIVGASGNGARELARLGFEVPSIHRPCTAREVEAALLRGR